MLQTNHLNLLSRLPYKPPFLFVDQLDEVDENGACGSFYLDPALDFYKGHFKDYPVTPGVILIEIMAQIGVVCLGLYLLNADREGAQPFAFTASDITFLKPVYPNERVRVRSQKIHFRFGKLKCKVDMKNEKNELVCSGMISGMLLKENAL